MTRLIFIINVLFAFKAQAQSTNFIFQGTIEYTKTVNTHAVLTKCLGVNLNGADQVALEQFKKNQPQFQTLNSKLTFDKNRLVFTPRKEELVEKSPDIPLLSQHNTTITNLDSGIVVSYKNIMDKMFVMKDSLLKVKWKLTDEVRDVAGFTCFRANGITMDSVYVVAFYAPTIQVSGGPEYFGGLPGMILEIALPHYNVNWRATKITGIKENVVNSLPRSTGRLIDRKQLLGLIETSLGGTVRGKRRDFIILDYLL